MSRWMVLLYFSKDCSVRLKVFSLFCVCYVLFVWKVFWTITVQYYIADRVRWVSKLTVLDSGTPWTFKSTLSAWNLLTQRGPSSVGRKMARREVRRWESIVGGAGLGRFGRTHSALLVGVQVLSGGFWTLQSQKAGSRLPDPRHLQRACPGHKIPIHSKIPRWAKLSTLPLMGKV